MIATYFYGEEVVDAIATVFAIKLTQLPALVHGRPAIVAYDLKSTPSAYAYLLTLFGSWIQQNHFSASWRRASGNRYTPEATMLSSALDVA